MTDKVQKIREEVVKMHNLLPVMDGDNISVNYADRICTTLEMYIDSLQEELVSNPIDFEQELYKAFGQVKDFTFGMRIAKWFYDMGKNSQKPVSEDLEEAAISYAATGEFLDNGKEMIDFQLEKAFKAGAKWQKEHLWKPADGDDLPEIEKEVIALEGIVDPTATDCFCGYKVVFAHRPTPEGYDGKSIATGVVEHYTPKTYGEGGWNVPNIAYWLDIELPREIEL